MRSRRIYYGRFLIFFIIVALVVGLIKVFEIATYSKHIEVSKIVVEGNVLLTQNDIMSKFNNLKGKNILLLNIKNIENILQDDIRLEKIELRKVFPDTLKISVEEKKPYVYIQLEDKLYISDKDGHIFAYRQELENANFPAIVVNKPENKELFFEILDIVENEFFLEISEIYEYEDIVHIVLKDGVNIKTNRFVDKNKYSVGYRLYNSLKQNGEKLEYIDLRFDDYIVK